MSKYYAQKRIGDFNEDVLVHLNMNSNANPLNSVQVVMDENESQFDTINKIGYFTDSVSYVHEERTQSLNEYSPIQKKLNVQNQDAEKGPLHNKHLSTKVPGVDSQNKLPAGEMKDWHVIAAYAILWTLAVIALGIITFLVAWIFCPAMIAVSIALWTLLWSEVIVLLVCTFWLVYGALNP